MGWNINDTQAVILFVTLVVLIVQVCVYWQQAVYMRQGLAETRKAADAATSALIMTHRPRLIVRPITVDGFNDDGSVGLKLTNGKAWITNVGVLPATLIAFHAEWLFAAALPLVNPARTASDYSTAASEVPPGHFGQRTLDDYSVPLEACFAINNVVEAATKGVSIRADGTLFLLGYIKYKDSIGTRRNFFCFEYDPLLQTFKPVEHHSYSYEE